MQFGPPRLPLYALLLCLGWTAPAYAAPGDLDSTFGTQGIALSAVPEEGAVAVALQDDGKILTVTLADAGADRASLRITRFTSFGLLDTSFGTAGVASVPLGVDTLFTARAMVRQASDGKLVVGGRSLDAFALTRLSSAGALDSGFGTSGSVKTTVSGDDEVLALFAQGDGKTVAVGGADDGLDSDFALVRYTMAGVPDTGFSGDGILTVEFGGNDIARAVTVQDNGAIIVAGSSEGSYSDLAIARVTSTGVLDSTFGTGGKVTTAVTPQEDTAYAVLVQPDGRIVVAGEADDAFFVVRYTSTGQLDPSFGTGGIARTNVVPGESDGARALVRQTDGRLIVAGQTSSSPAGDFAVLRYTSGGVLDSSFGNAGVATISVAASFDEELTGALLQGDGKLVTAGLSEDGQTSYQIVTRSLTGGINAVCGDADANGTVQASDALRILRAAVGQSVSCPLSVCDVDANGSVQAGDALRVLKKAVGQPVLFSCTV